MAVVLSQSKLQSSTVRKFNAKSVSKGSLFVYRPLTQELFCKASATFISLWNLQCFYVVSSQFSLQSCNLFFPLTLNGGYICPRRCKKKVHKDLHFSKKKRLRADNLIRWVLFQAMQKPVGMININLHGNTFAVYVV